MQEACSADSHPPSMFPSLQRKFEHWVFDLPEAVGGRPLGWLCRPAALLSTPLLRDMSGEVIGLRAMSLVYSTLFALVPIVAVAFAVLKGFGYGSELEPVLFEFLKPLGDQASVVTERIMGFVENVQSTVLGTIGVVFLIYTTVTMIQKVEEALNFAYGMSNGRGARPAYHRVPRRDADRSLAAVSCW